MSGQIVFNIPEVEINGVEIELSKSFDTSLDTGLSAGWIDSETTRFDGIEQGFAGPMNQASGAPVKCGKFHHVNHRQVNVSASYTTQTEIGDLVSRVDWAMNGNKRWSIVDGQNQEGTRNFVQASFILSNHGWEVIL